MAETSNYENNGPTYAHFLLTVVSHRLNGYHFTAENAFVSQRNGNTREIAHLCQTILRR